MRIRFDTVVSNLIMLNVVMMLLEVLVPSVGLEIKGYFALYPFDSPFFEWWQPVSYMFLHANFSHMFFNLFALWMFGRQLEYNLGQQRFLFYYLFTGVGAAFLNLWIMSLTGDYAITIGASGAVYGILLAFGFLYPNMPLMLLFFPVPIKAKYFVIGYGVLELLQGIGRSSSGIAHFAHLGGMLFGLALLLYWRYYRRIL